MSASSPLSIGQWLQTAEQALTDAGITTARLDAQLITNHIFHKNTAWLLAHSDEPLPVGRIGAFQEALRTRLQRVPIAYITGCKEFYGREFSVSSDVLIPRPETEALVQITLELLPNGPSTIADIGTGSGCIAITLACERPTWHIYANDISTAALAVANRNAQKLHASVTFYQDNLLQKPVLDRFDGIVANLPYVPHTTPTSPEVAHEPQLAVFAPDNGLRYMLALISQSSKHLNKGGVLVLEAEPTQHARLIAQAANYGFTLAAQHGFIVAFRAKTVL